MLKTNYKDAAFSGSRKYKVTSNSDGTATFADATSYTVKGDKFGAADINATNKAVNALIKVEMLELLPTEWSATAPYTLTKKIDGMSVEDRPEILLNLYGAQNRSEEKFLKKQFGYISYFLTENGKITFTAKFVKPTTTIPIQLKGVSY